MPYRLTIDKTPYKIDVEEIDGQKQKYLIRYNNTERIIEAFSSSLSLYTLLIDQKSYDVSISNGAAPPSVFVNGQYFQLGFERNAELPYRKKIARKSSGPVDIRANMPGKIVKILVKIGDDVKAGQALLVLEAMKMENELLSPQDGKISAIHVQSGQSVENGQKLATLSSL